MKKTLCLVLIALLTALTACPALSEAAADPVVVRVGDVTFTKSQLESAVDTDVTLSEMMTQEYLPDEEKLGQRDETIQRFIGVGLIEMKLRDAGKNDFTGEEEASLRATAMSQYEAMWQGIWQRAQQSDQGFTEDQVTEFMQEQGYTSEAIFEELKANERRHRAVEMFCPSMTLTEDMVEKYYEAQYDEALEALKSAQQAYTDKRKALALPLVRETVEAINAEIDAGIDFNSIINKYSTDKNEQNLDKGGYPVHPDSKNWPGEFLEAVGKLEKPGDTSGPVLTDMGIHILYYASDIPEGAHELTAEERSALNASALYYYQTLELEKQMEDWMDEYEIETHPELLDD